MSHHRRRPLAASIIIAVFLAAVVAACGGSEGSETSSDQEDLTIVTFGGTTGEGFESAIAAPFTEESGIETNVTEPVDYGKYTAMIEKDSVTWDFVDAEGFYVVQNPEFWAETDTDVVKTDPSDYFVVPDQEPGTNGVPADLPPSGSYAFTIAYQTDTEDHPTTWAEFFDTEAFPGKRAMYNWPYGMLEVALLADGVSHDDLYPLDVPRAIAKLDTIKDDIVFWNSGAELQQIMSSGEADYAFAWNNRIADIQRKGAPVAIEWNENLQDGSFLVTPKNGPAVEETMELFDFALQPEVQAQYAEATGYSPGLKSALELIPEENLVNLNAYQPNVDKAVGGINLQWWADNFDMAIEEFNAWAGA